MSDTSAEYGFTAILALRTIVWSALMFGAFWVVRFINWYHSLYTFFQNCQGVKDFSWRKGNLHVYTFEFEKTILIERDWMQRYPKYYRMWMGPFVPQIRVYHPDTVRPVLKTAEPKPRGWGTPYENLVPWLGEGLIIAGGERWSRSRRLLSPAFHHDVLKSYVDVINNAVDVFIAKVDLHVEAGSSFELFSMSSLLSFDILLRCSMSVTENVQELGNEHPYLNAINEILGLCAYRYRRPLMYWSTIFFNTKKGKRFQDRCDFVHKWAEELIEKRRQTLEEEGPPKARYLDFLDILLTVRDDDGNSLTSKEIRSEVDTLLLAGHDTTATAVAFLVHTLSSRPELQVRLQEDMDALTGDRGSQYVTWNDSESKQMDLLNRCIKEGLRYHSPVPGIHRKLEADKEIDGKVFPAGTQVSVALWNLHHNPDVWPEPEVFDPDRFLPENVQKMDPYSFVAFSAGPRNCIGQHFALLEQKIIMGRLLKRYPWLVHVYVEQGNQSLTAKTGDEYRYTFRPDLSYEVIRQHASVLRTEKGLWVYAERRR